MTPAPVPAAAVAAAAALHHPPAAHRGLWSPGGPPENSLAAFAAAAEAGYAVELDVRLSADEAAMVFHDAGLERMTGRPGALAAHPAAALGAMRLNGSRAPIPTLDQALAEIDGRVMVYVELKTPPGAEGPLEAAVAAALDAYAGPAAVIGFNPASHAWWAEHRPDRLRGLNRDATAPPDVKSPSQAFDDMDIARPHFLALSTDLLTGPAAAAARAAGFPILAWTVRSPEQAATVAAHCDNLIFEGFRP